jgi:hypothetical protein
MRLKTLVDKVHTSSVLNIEEISYLERQLYGGVIQVGYDASKVKEHMPNAVNIDDKGFMSVNYIQVLVARWLLWRNNLNNYKMAFSSKSNGCIQSSIKWRVYIEKWANKSYTLQMMTKDMAFMYNLSPTTGSNDILGNQLMQKKFLVSSFKYTISRKSYCRK